MPHTGSNQVLDDKGFGFLPEQEVQSTPFEECALDLIGPWRKFTHYWLTRYPWPQRCIHDPGGEFTEPEFQTLLQNCHIRDVCTTAKNPQSKAVCERMHQTVGNILRTLLHEEPPQNITNEKEYVDEALSIAMHAMSAGIYSTLGSSPGSLTYNRDTFLNIPLHADWHAITQR